jgi:tetratricopeptide (TPR) repeat protein
MAKTAHELTRKDMKSPDKFQVAASEAATWVTGHRNLIIGGIVLLAALAVGTVLIGSYFEGRKAKAGGLLYRALEAASGEVSTVPLPNFNRPTYKTAEEKYKAVSDAAQQVQQRHEGSRSAITAALVEGDARLALREWDQAIAAYQRYLSSAPADDSLRFAAIDGLARALEAKNDLDAAARTYEQGAEIAFYRDRAAIERARVLSRAGKKDEARKALEGVAKESPVFSEAQERLATLSK